jgi:hypothetical protein
MSDKPIYEKLETETQKAYEAFCCYRDMGSSRSIDRVAQESTKSRSIIRTWCKEHDWVKRAEVYDVAREAIARQILEEENRELYREKLRQYNKRDEEIGHACRASGVAGLQKLKKFLDNVAQEDITMRNAANLARIVDICFERGEHLLNNAYAIDKLLQKMAEDEEE